MFESGIVNRKITHIDLPIWIQKVMVTRSTFPNLKYVKGATYCAQWKDFNNIIVNDISCGDDKTESEEIT